MPFYRYFDSELEAEQIMRERRIQSLNPQGTWWTTYRFDDPVVAETQLSLPSRPRFRAGPIPDAVMPPFNAIALRPVAGYFGHPGGALEGQTAEPVWLSGLYSFDRDAFVL